MCIRDRIKSDNKLPSPKFEEPKTEIDQIKPKKSDGIKSKSSQESLPKVQKNDSIYYESDESMNLNLDELLRKYKKQNVTLEVNDNEGVGSYLQEPPKSARVLSKPVEMDDSRSHKSHKHYDVPETIQSVLPTMDSEIKSAFRWDYYQETVPNVEKSQLMDKNDKLLPSIPNPSEPVLGWLKFQVGFIPICDNSESIQKASQIYDFESLLKEMRKE